MKNRLTKTDYLLYLTCPNEFWLKQNRPDVIKADVDSMEYEHLRQQGYAVESYVKQLRRFQPADGKVVEFQRVFQTADLYARSDVTVTDTSDGVIDLFEVKASASIKPEHIEDAAFQKYIAERSGFTVGRVHLITMNGEYVRRGEIDVEQLFIITDVTDETTELMPTTEEQILSAIAYSSTEPIPSIAAFCAANKLECPFIKLHFPDLPEYTVFNVSRLNKAKLAELLDRGVIDIVDIPGDFKLSSKQQIQVNAAKAGEVVIDRNAIRERIESWKYPLHFLDYETFSYAIPLFDGVRPFQQMCFQYSLHTIPESGSEPVHSFYLSTGETAPARSLAEKLEQDLSGTNGTVFVWYEPFEKTRNDEMGMMYPEFAGFFSELNTRVYDLMKIFSENLFVHPDFRGSSSIKKVLPVLVPHLSYRELGIGDGMTASISWFRAATWETTRDIERQQIFDDLEKYCHLDTLAMVEIFKRLREL